MVRVSTIVMAVLIITQVSKISSSSRVQQFQEIEERLEKIARNKLALANQISRQLARLVSLSCDNREDCVDNPLAAFTLVRRLAHDWSALVIVAGSDEKLLPLSHFRWPDESHLSAAAHALTTAQMTYNLSTVHLVQGILTSDAVSANITVFTGEDCFLVAKNYHSSSYYSEAIEWLQQTLNKINGGDSSVSYQEVMYHLAAAYYLDGDFNSFRTTIKELKIMYPQSEPPDSLIADIILMAMEDSETLKAASEEKEIAARFHDFDPEVHQDLCQGKVNLKSELRCRYVHYQFPHLRFQPFKVEELHLDPPVLRFYDAITENESRIVRQEATKVMTVARVTTEDGSGVESLSRTSHVAWLINEESGVGNSLHRRIRDMTQLDMSHAEHHQVSRYGLAGEFVPHLDGLGEKIMPIEFDRLATFMFYLSDVKQGGHTVFLNWGLSVPPVKNSAVFWFNFQTNGNLDFTSFHSGCPVLRGSKWVLNKWIGFGGNELTRPCDLHKNSSYAKYYTQ